MPNNREILPTLVNITFKKYNYCRTSWSECKLNALWMILSFPYAGNIPCSGECSMKKTGKIGLSSLGLNFLQHFVQKFLLKCLEYYDLWKHRTFQELKLIILTYNSSLNSGLHFLTRPCVSTVKMSILTNPNRRCNNKPTTMGKTSGSQGDSLLALTVSTGVKSGTVG